MLLEAIKLEQQQIFKRLKHFPSFYLVGGTALALQIGHRLSLDFDLFSKDEIPKGLLTKVKRVFRDFKIESIVNYPEQLSIKVGQTRVDFVKYDFPLLFETVELEGVKLVSVPEIAAMKAFVIGHRGTLKDYVDLYFLLKEGYIELKEIKKLAEKKYKNEFNFRLFLEQLIYLEDIKQEEIEFLKKPVTKKEIGEFFEKEIKKIRL